MHTYGLYNLAKKAERLRLEKKQREKELRMKRIAKKQYSHNHVAFYPPSVSANNQYRDDSVTDTNTITNTITSNSGKMRKSTHISPSSKALQGQSISQSPSQLPIQLQSTASNSNSGRVAAGANVLVMKPNSASRTDCHDNVQIEMLGLEQISYNTNSLVNHDARGNIGSMKHYRYRSRPQLAFGVASESTTASSHSKPGSNVARNINIENETGF